MSGEMENLNEGKKNPADNVYRAYDLPDVLYISSNVDFEMGNEVEICSSENESTSVISNQERKGNLIFISESIDLDIGTEVEIMSSDEIIDGSDQERKAMEIDEITWEEQAESYNQERNSRRALPCESIAQWITRNVVGINNDHLAESESSIIIPPDSASSAPSTSFISAPSSSISSLSTGCISSPSASSDLSASSCSREEPSLLAISRRTMHRLKVFERDTFDLRRQVLIRNMQIRRMGDVYSSDEEEDWFGD